MGDPITTSPDGLTGDDPGAVAVSVSTYDAVPYSVSAFPQSHPDRLATIARLFGVPATDPQDCRVLELGCAAGGNLIPMAISCPRSQFLGVDLSQVQIADGVSMVSQLEIGNVDLRQCSILDVDDSFGHFDYILVHGVYSWVPPQVQRKILDICRDNLAPRGVAYVSYNAYPGWHARAAVREMLWYHTQHIGDPAQRVLQAKALLTFLTTSVPVEDGGYSALLRQELALLLNVSETYLLHEHLEEFNEPLYFHQFVQRAADCGLQYLGEAHLSSMMPGHFSTKVEELLRKMSGNLLQMEQYMDFLRNRMFRQTLLCHANVPVNFALRPDALRGFRIASSAKSVAEAPDLQGNSAVQFKAQLSRSLTTSDPIMKCAMAQLAAAWPASIEFETLLDQARSLAGRHSPDDAPQLASRLLNCYASGLVECSLSPPVFTTTVSEKPVAAPYVRLRAECGSTLTNLRLEGVTIDGPSRHVLRHLDGQHDRAALHTLVADWCRNHNHTSVTSERIETFLAKLLPAFAKAALLIA